MAGQVRREFQARARQTDGCSASGRRACKRRYSWEPWIRELGALCWHLLTEREELGQSRGGLGEAELPPRTALVLRGG